MKKNELTKLREKSIDELKKLVSDKKIELIKIQSDLKANREKNLKKVKNQKLELAQILTIVMEKEIIEAESRTSKSGITGTKGESTKK